MSSIDDNRGLGLRPNLSDDGLLEPSPLVDFIAGTSAGIASLLAGHPFDTIKTRLQAQSHSTSNTISIPQNVVAVQTSSNTPLLQQQNLPRYSSAFDALRRIIAEERFIGLYKGITSPMLGVAAMNASVFGVYGLALRFLGGEDQQNRLTDIFLAGCASGVVSALITSPIELIKIRQQLSFDTTKRTPSTLQVIQNIWQKRGIRGLYRGLGTTSIRDLGYGPYFLSYEVFNRTLLSFHDQPNSSTELSNIEMAISGGLAGVVGWLSTFAIDVIKTRVQATDSSSVRSGNAFIFAARQTYAEGGFTAFFAGLGPTILRAIPANAVLFLAFEYTKSSMIRLGL
ncbi:hypothetical protein L7F22_052719 [Adiantum nelumboides]|nr:hypothetical protein [Adiantum nelumboides]